MAVTTLEALKDKQKWWIKDKIAHSLMRIKEFYDHQDGNVFVAYSGGKDSTVLLHLVRSLYPNVEAVFCNTTNEYKEILEQVANTPNCITLMPKMTFNETVKKYGFPLVSKRTSKAITTLRRPEGDMPGEGNFNVRRLYMEGVTSKGVLAPRWKLAKKWKPLIDAQFDITEKCCDILKKEPSHRYEKDTGKKPYVGTMASESTQRTDSYINHGCNTYTGRTASHPLSIWTDEDIWLYIKDNNITIAEVYYDKKLPNGIVIQGEKRTGCAYCAFGAHLERGDTNRFQRLSLRKPKQFEKMMKLENNGVTFREALGFINVDVDISSRLI